MTRSVEKQLDEQPNNERLPDEKEAAGSSYGLFLIVLGASAAWLASGIESKAFADRSDPGPAMWPTLMALLLLAIGVVETTKTVRAGRAAEWLHGWRVVQRFLRDRGGRDALFVAGGLAAYLALIPIVGVSCGAVVFCSLLLRRLGSSWWAAVLTAVVLAAAARMLFVGLFSTPLPEGMFERLW